MSELNFHDRVAIVTGAGRGIGRAYALLLAERGAKVVVNDLGGSLEGDGSDTGPAQAVADEITAAGGQAVADTSDVATRAGGEAIVTTALNTFGRIDVVVSNAGIVKYGGLPDVTQENLERHLDVHLVGAFTVLKAAWPHLREQGYGRVVVTTSTGVFGLPDNLPYAAAKAGVIGLARSAKLAGEPHNIKVNVIAPNAITRMAGDAPLDSDPAGRDSVMPPAAVAPMVGYLAHESCPVSGEIYVAGGGRFARLFLASTDGYVHTGGAATVEDVAAHWTKINDESDYYVPESLISWSGEYLKHQFASAGD